jgi:hypothetical protein
MGIPVRDSDSRRKKAYDDTMAAMIKGTETLVPQPVPPGSGEAAVGRGGVPIPRSYRRDRAPGEKPEGTPIVPEPQ